MNPYLKRLLHFMPFALATAIATVSLAITVQATMPRVLDLALLYQRDIPTLLGLLAVGAVVTYIFKNL